MNSPELKTTPNISLIANISERLEMLSQLEAGWLDGEGEVISKADIDYLVSSLKNVDCRVPVYIYPTPTAGILLEFSHDGITEQSVEVDFKNQQIILSTFNSLANDSYTTSLPFSPSNWKAVKHYIEDQRS